MLEAGWAQGADGKSRFLKKPGKAESDFTNEQFFHHYSNLVFQMVSMSLY